MLHLILTLDHLMLQRAQLRLKRLTNLVHLLFKMILHQIFAGNRILLNPRNPLSFILFPLLIVNESV